MATPTILDRPDGSVQAVNLKRLNEIPFWLSADAPANTTLVAPVPPPAGWIPNLATISVAQNQSSQPIIMSISGEGPGQITHFSMERFLSNATPYASPVLVGKCLLQIQDGQQMRALMNGAAHVDTIFGSHDVVNNPLARPYPLPEALYVDEQRSIVATFTDLAGAFDPGPPIVPVNNNFRPSFECARLLTRVPDANLSRARARMDQRQYLTMPYFYVLDNGFAHIPNTGTVMETVTIGQDHHFEMMQISAVSNGPFSIQILNVGTGESIIDAPLGSTQQINSLLAIGDANYPFRFHESIFCEIHTKLLVTLTDLSPLAPPPAPFNDVYISIGGRILADRMWK